MKSFFTFILLLSAPAIFPQDWQSFFLLEKTAEIQEIRDEIVEIHGKLSMYIDQVDALEKQIDYHLINSIISVFNNPSEPVFKGDKSFSSILVEQAKNVFGGHADTNLKNQGEQNIIKSLDNILKTSPLLSSLNSVSPIFGVLSNTLSVVSNTFFSSGFLSVEPVQQDQSKVDKFYKGIQKYITYYERMSSLCTDLRVAIDKLEIDIAKNSNSFSVLIAAYKTDLTKNPSVITLDSKEREVSVAYGFPSEKIEIATPGQYLSYKNNEQIMKGYKKLIALQNLNIETKLLQEQLDSAVLFYFPHTRSKTFAFRRTALAL